VDQCRLGIGSVADVGSVRTIRILSSRSLLGGSLKTVGRRALTNYYLYAVWLIGKRTLPIYVLRPVLLVGASLVLNGENDLARNMVSSPVGDALYPLVLTASVLGASVLIEVLLRKAPGIFLL
jgi:hypothetical protein